MKIFSAALSLIFYQGALLWRGNPPPPRPHHGEANIPLLQMPDLFPNPDLAQLAGLGATLLARTGVDPAPREGDDRSVTPARDLRPPQVPDRGGVRRGSFFWVVTQLSYAS